MYLFEFNEHDNFCVMFLLIMYSPVTLLRACGVWYVIVRIVENRLKLINFCLFKSVPWVMDANVYSSHIKWHVLQA